MTFALARRVSRKKASAVREILKVAERPEVISFAGGLPAPELFPIEQIAKAHQHALEKYGGAALQYSITEGFEPLRAWIADDLKTKGINATPESILITSGSQQGLDLIAKVALDVGSVVVVENPSYLAALQVFEGAEAQLVTVPSDDEGLDVEQLEKVLNEHDVRLIYLVPNFQNPKGITISEERRRAVVRLAARHGVLVLEDDPYGELRYRGQALPPLASIDEDNRVVYLGTFSKTLAPGLRMGFMHAPANLRPHITIAKQASDLHCGSLSQRATFELLSNFDYQGHLSALRTAYGKRCDVMMELLEKSLPKGSRMTRPTGGLFVGVELPKGIDAEALLKEALAKQVAYVPGAAFFAERAQKHTMRLNFSHPSEERIVEGMKRLKKVFEKA